MIWAAVVADPARSTRQVVLATTLVLGLTMASPIPSLAR